MRPEADLGKIYIKKRYIWPKIGVGGWGNPNQSLVPSGHLPIDTIRGGSGGGGGFLASGGKKRCMRVRGNAAF